MYDINKVREDFPILSRQIYGKPLVYLDNAATTQKPLCVLDAMRDEYLNVNANVHRGVHYLSQQATDLHEAARETVRCFINANSTSEIVFTRGTTEGLNLVASSFVEEMMGEGDEVIVSVMEHHSNIVPWQLQAAKRGIAIRVIPMDDEGKLDMDAYEALFSERTRLVSVAHVSNVLGTVNPVKEMARIAHEHGVPIMVDGAQSTPHFRVDMQDIDCDFFVFSGHKMYGPTGIGVLYGKKKLLKKMPPFLYGGEMINWVSRETQEYAPLPHKFEAGTVNAAGAVGLHAAIDYIQSIGFEIIEAREAALTKIAFEGMQQIEGVHIIGSDKWEEHKGIITFTIDGVHPHDIAAIFDADGVNIRAGNHCAQPLLDHLGTGATARMSLAFYNTVADVERFLVSLSTMRERMGYGR